MTEDGKKEKESWVSNKVGKLVSEGKSQEEAVAIAYSMWEEKEKETDACKKKDCNVDYSDWDMTSSFEETPEGFLRGRAIITNVGVFSYRNKDGTVRRELRLPEEVFKKEALDSIIGKPLTNNHPPEFVNADNIKKYVIGTVMGPVTCDAYHVSVGIVVTDKQAIDDIKSGKTGLSCGYNLELDWTPGVWMGMQYDCIQRNIQINHVALVDKARAGDAAKIHLDSAVEYNIQMEVDSMAERALRTINLDNVEYQAEDAVIDALKKAQDRADSLEKDLAAANSDKTTIEAERDTLKEKNDTLSKELTEIKAKAIDSAEVDKRVKERMALLAIAAKAKVEATDSMDAKAIKEAVVKAIFPKANLDGKSEEYVQARFDLAVEGMDKEQNADEETRKLNDDTAGKGGTSADKLAEARKRMASGYGKTGK